MATVDMRPTDFLRDVITETGITQSDGDMSQEDMDQEQASAQALMILADARAKDKYSCLFCHAQFTIRLALNKHMNVYHNVRKPYECSTCNKRFSKAYILKKHTQSAHRYEKPFQCDVCSIRFTDIVSLKRHNQIHAGQLPHSCSLCPKKFRSKYLMNEHAKVHSNEKAYVCVLCTRSCYTKSDLRQHLHSHSGVGSYPCDLCDHSFFSAKRLASHKKDHQNANRNENTSFRCTFCKLVVNSLSAFEDHIKLAHKPETKIIRTPIPVTHSTSFNCSECQIFFQSFDDLSIHLEIDHNSFQCRYCYLQFNSKSAVNTHIHQSHRSLACHVCDKPFSDQASLTNHLATHDLFTCFHCDSSFNDLELMKKHQNNIHFPESMETCTICTQQFSTRARLKRHLSCHLPPARYKCDVCHVGFNQFKSVHRHMEIVHDKPPPALKYPTQTYQIVQDDEVCTVSLVDGATKTDLNKMVVSELVDSFICNVCHADVGNKTQMETHVEEHGVAELLLCVLEQERTKAQLSGMPPPKDIVLSGPCKEEDKENDEDLADEFNENELDVMMKSRPKPPTVVVKRYTSTRCRFCDKLLASEHDLTVHEKMHVNNHDFRCMACNEEFVDGEDLIKHRRMHKRRLRRSYQCAHCGIIMNDANLIKMHIDTHTGFAKDDKQPEQSETTESVKADRFGCQTCGLLFDGSSDYRLHLRSHRVGKKHKCKSCGRGYHKVSSLKYHEKSHRVAAPYCCGICSDRFDAPYRLVIHMAGAHGLGKFACAKCDRRFQTKRKCREHQKSHLSKGIEPYLCAVCDCSFITVNGLRSHVKRHCSELRQQATVMNKVLTKSTTHEESLFIHEDPQEFWCVICSESFQREEDYINHGSKHFKCDLCAVEFADAMELECHSLDHAALDKNICLTCGDAYENDELLWEHTLTFHNSSPICRCQKCNCILLSHRHSQIHMLTHPLDKEVEYHCDYFCNICQHLFTTESFLNIHSERHKPCQICNDVSDDLTLHLLQNHSLPQVEKCFHCDKVLSDPVSRADHLNTHALTPQVIDRCAECEAGFPDLETLDEHVKVKHDTEVVKCMVCGMICLGKEEVDRHLKNDHIVYAIHRCKKCPKIFLNSPVDAMVQHAASHDLKVHLSCCECEMKFTDENLLAQHLQTHDSLTNLYACVNCSANFPAGQDLLVHMRQQHGVLNQIDLGMFVCGICRSEIPISDISRHVDSHLLKGKQFPCEVCPLSFTKKSSLLRHSLKHSNERPVICCGKSFRSQDRLNIHKLSHIPSAYICDVASCGKQFALRVQRRRHKMREHGFDAPFRCLLCHAVFIERTELNRHMRRHGGGRKFQCSVCEMSLSTSKKLQLHLRNKHNQRPIERPSECQVCLTPLHSEAMVQNHVCPAGVVPMDDAVAPEVTDVRKNVIMEAMPPDQDGNGFMYVAMGEDVELQINAPHCPICMVQFSSQEEANSHMLLHQGV